MTAVDLLNAIVAMSTFSWRLLYAYNAVRLYASERTNVSANRILRGKIVAGACKLTEKHEPASRGPSRFGDDQPEIRNGENEAHQEERKGVVLRELVGYHRNQRAE